MLWSNGKCIKCGKTVPTAEVCPHCNHKHSAKWKKSNDSEVGWAVIVMIVFYIWVNSSKINNYCDGPVTWHYPGGEKTYEPSVAWDSDAEKVIIKTNFQGVVSDWKPMGDGYHRISGSTVYWTSEDTRYRIVAENCD